ncbi:MAG: hypothetical protein KAH96_04355 [Alphaproteobacteria bacterium]|nr:hypothetical protein [Alphaproteobacteria bacterium]
MKKRLSRAQQIDKIFKVYNGSAVSYNAQKTSNKSIAQICSTGSKLAKGQTISKLLNEIRK